ncbi:DNA-directed RNA polymerase, subunit F [Thermococcus onnurineus NA1]|uniref:DNA-directed RNA polymerase subunit Rpo4 n=1 Tax=Thermococcus onnurineus (strain NA1) TaxID=523850 RepID=B6YTK5_THEON|nr:MULTISPECIES: RNA polymerase Rpb4 family protein [Thermococcus]ACJ15892.1 DNA-directed RNA polymerase, subunit F [Thermococcus onnurineus NA1]NJE46389.1 DNA-directed RNA polymerase subunit F [Thermococcus sp. GR7]NJE77692.1 DNA-directed RNA polymerase subunit F [Thermococcus sp. GR4]NJF23731.1 DNA-directed RNA polymerase subunit F [Thermococcus sp. GR5]
MIGRKKLEERYLTIAETKELLERRKAEGVEENPEEPMFYEARVSLEHAERFAKLKPEQAVELKEKLIGLFEWLDERLAAKLVDLMPEDYFDIRVIFTKEDYMPTREEAEEIIKLLDDYRE